MNIFQRADGMEQSNSVLLQELEQCIVARHCTLYVTEDERWKSEVGSGSMKPNETHITQWTERVPADY